MDELSFAVRGLLALLRDEGVPDRDLIGVARYGVLLIALARAPEMADLRAWIGAQPGSPDPEAPAARYARALDGRVTYFWVIWDEAAARLGAETFPTLWALLDTVEGERLAERVLMESAE